MKQHGEPGMPHHRPDAPQRQRIRRRRAGLGHVAPAKTPPTSTSSPTASRATAAARRDPANAPSCGERLEQRCNLYVSHEGVTKLVAVLSGTDDPDWAAEYVEYGATARVSPNGQWLAFMSNRSLTGYDNRDAVSGEPDEEVYLYDAATEHLTCASCEPTGARPYGREYQNKERAGS